MTQPQQQFHQNHVVASAYAQRGWKVLPLHSVDERGKCTCNKDCDSPGKHPRTQNGVKDATNQTALVDYYWGLYRGANVGIATGAESGLVVVDIDPGHGGDITLLEQQYGALPRSMRVTTGSGGEHIYLAYPAAYEVRNTQNQDASWTGIDIRGEGGYVVAPPSLHATGGVYEWLDNDFDNGLAVDTIPAAWRDGLAKGTRRSTTPTPTPGERIVEGARNQYLASLGGSLRRYGASQEEIQAAILMANENRCSPPLGEDEALRIGLSMSRYEPEPDAALEVPEVAHTLVQALCEEVKSDPGAPFKRVNLRALALLQEEDPAAFHTAWAVFKKAGTMVGALKKEMSKQKKIEAQNALPTPEAIEDAPISLSIPDKWSVTSNGVYGINPETGVLERVLPVPLWLTKRLRSIDTGEERIELVWKRDGGMQRLVADSSIVFNSRTLTSLRDHGLPVSSESSGKTVKFLSDLEAQNLDTIPLERCTERAGWISAGRFFPGLADDVTFAPQDRSMIHAFSAHGDYEEWKRGVLAMRNKYPLLRLQLAASFAAPLLKLTGHRNFILHLWGDSGSGKTATLRTALSVWGSRGLMSTFHATVLGLQNRAQMMCDVPFGINERQVGAKNLDTTLYALCEGVGKVQGAKSGGNRALQFWRSIILTNGEEPLTKTQSMQGTRTRAIELEGTPIRDEQDAMAIYDIVDKHFGHAGPAFVAELASLEVDELSALRTRMSEACAHEAEDRTVTHIQALTLVCVADYLASKWVFDLDDETAWNQAVLLGWFALEQTDTKVELSAVDRAYDLVRGLFYMNRHRFRDEADNVEKWGYVDGDTVWFVTAALEREIQNAGHSYRASLRQLNRDSLLESEIRAGKVRFGIRKRGSTFNGIKMVGAEDLLSTQKPGLAGVSWGVSSAES
jgi:putative DNA primase/helicase